MRAIEVTFALFLGVTGIIGCASSERLYQPTATPAFPSPIVNYSVADFSDVPFLASTPDVSENSSEPAVTPVRNPLAQSSATPPLSPFEWIEAKSEHGSSKELSWQSSQSSHRASHPAPPRITPITDCSNSWIRPLKKLSSNPRSAAVSSFLKRSSTTPGSSISCGIIPVPGRRASKNCLPARGSISQ